jgi:hypothetical protein
MQPPYDGLRNAVVFEDLKQAALYFDRVLPVCFRQIRDGGGKILVEIPEVVPSKAFVDVVYGVGSADSALYPTLFFDFFDRWSEFVKAVSSVRISKAGSSKEDDYADLPQLYQSNVKLNGSQTIRDAFQKYSRSLGAEFSTVVTFGSSSHPEADASYYALTLVRLPWIDADAASWEQIIELRHDIESTQKLRRLRLFFYENYASKTPAFITDDLLRRLDDYEAVRKKHGFEVLTGSLSSILTATNLTSAVGVGLAAALFGGPIAGIGSTAIVEAGNFAIELSKKLYAVREFEKGHEFAYLIDAKKRLK